MAGRTTKAAVPDRTSVKLIVRSNAGDRALEWLSSGGGDPVSAPADVRSSGTAMLIANVPLTRLSELDGQPSLRRAEAPKEMFARMDSAREKVTGLDAALALPVHNGLTGTGVLLAVVDSGVDW